MMAVSYEELMEKKLDRIDDRRDKRQGSLIYDALAPNAAETAQFYADLDLLADRTFADTAVGEDLTRRAAERGMLRKGVKATFYGRFLDADGAVYPVENGTRFALEEYKYIVLGRETDGRYILECETEGACGNVYLGELLPLETMPDLAKATLEELRTDGEDAEGDEELRKRFVASFDADAFGGNIADYKRKVNAMQNVGGLKVYPAWNGGGTVKLVLIDQGWRRPTETELAALQKEIDPESKGEGYGIAPIGHKVTVEGVTEVRCNIALQLSVAEDVTKGTVLTKLTEGFSAYFEELRKNWADSDFLTVRISHLESRALETDGVVDVSDCGINLMALPLMPDAELPKFKSCVKHPKMDEDGFVLYYTDQCPFTAYWVPKVQETAQAHNIPLKVVHITDKETARNLPAPVTTYALFRDGKFVTQGIQSDKKFLKLAAE